MIRIENKYQWLKHLQELQGKETLEKDDLENAQFVAMILHPMNVIKNAVQYNNSGQTPVITLDQPLFAIAKQIQWNWPASHGENQFVIMLGGLHIEMAAFKVLGLAWLNGSGWTSVITDARVICTMDIFFGSYQ